MFENGRLAWKSLIWQSATCSYKRKNSMAVKTVKHVKQINTTLYFSSRECNIGKYPAINNWQLQFHQLRKLPGSISQVGILKLNIKIQ